MSTTPTTEGAAPDTPELRAFSAFLAAMHDSKLSGKAMREAIDWTIKSLAPTPAPLVELARPTAAQAREALAVLETFQQSVAPIHGGDYIAVIRAFIDAAERPMQGPTSIDSYSAPADQVTVDLMRLFQMNKHDARATGAFIRSLRAEGLGGAPVLSDAQINEIFQSVANDDPDVHIRFARAILATGSQQ